MIALEKIAKNNKFYWYVSSVLLASNGLIIPAFYLFFRDVCGLSLQEILFLQILYAFFVLVLEVPSGYLADCLGRRRCVVFGSWMAVFAIATYTVADSIVYCIVAEVFFALGDALLSGADKALLYDSLKAANREDEFEATLANSSGLLRIILVISCLLGGLIMTYDLRLPFILLFFLFIVRALVSHRYIEDQSTFQVARKEKVSFLKIVNFCFLQEKRIAWLILVTGSQFGLLILSFWTMVPLFEVSGLSVQYYGAMFASFSIISGLSSYFAKSIRQRLGVFNSYFMLWFLIFLGFFLSSTVPGILGIIFLCLFQIARGYGEVFLSTALNDETPSECRATVLSFSSMVGRILFVLILCMSGWNVQSEDILSMWHFLALLTICFAVLFSLLALGLKRMRVS